MGMRTPLPSPADQTRAARPARLGSVSHEGALAANTGRTHGDQAWEEGRERQVLLRQQTERLAALLEEAGIHTRLPSDVWMVGDVTGGVERAESWRAIRFLPLVAQRDRRPVASALKLWLRTARYVRYAVVTSGERVPLGGDLKARQAEHTANIRRWSSEASERYGVELLLRATEYTVNDEGVHLHSNIAYRLARPLPSPVWAEFLSWSRGRLQAHWKDCGQLRDADEVVKYCVKPAELDRLDGDQVAWLFEQTYRAKMVQPLGGFADWLRGLERDRLKVAQVYGADGKSRFRLVTKMEREPSTGTGGGQAGENVICGRTLPQARWCPWSEPVSLVMGYTNAPTTADGVRRLALLRARQAEARTWWDANGAPDPASLRVHTDRPTVQATATGTTSGGTVFDLATGEVLYEPPPAAEEAREGARQAARDAHQDATVATMDRIAAWHAQAPERAAWERVVAAEREMQTARRVA